MRNIKRLHLLLTLLIISLSLAACAQNGKINMEKKVFTTIEPGVLTIGTYGEINPMTFVNKNGELVGFEIDMANHISDELGMKPTFKTMSFPDMFSAIENKNIDIIISSLTITEERQKNYMFSTPYFESGQIILKMRGNNTINDVEDLAEKKIGVLTGTTGEQAVGKLEHIREENVFSYSSAAERNKALLNGDIEAAIEDLVGATGTVKDNKEFAVINKPITQEYYGVMSSMQNSPLIDEINRILREMKRDGLLNDYNKKWVFAN